MVIMPMREYKRIWIRVQRDTPAVAQFLKDNPAVVVSPNGGLKGLVFTDDPANITHQARAELDKKYLTPGLNGLLVRSTAELVGEAEKGDHSERH
jgi:hypothetical protein